MITRLYKSLVALIFLLFFISGKAFSLHALVHDHDATIIECEVCENALLNQFSPLDSQTVLYEIEDTKDFFRLEIVESYISKVYKVEPSSVLFGRPPPSF